MSLYSYYVYVPVSRTDSPSTQGEYRSSFGGDREDKVEGTALFEDEQGGDDELEEEVEAVRDRKRVLDS
jgi:hypothetical protein